MEKLTFKVNEYEGPLDLILALLSKHQIGIYDINISDLLEQYMAYIRTLRENQMEIASEFLEMASRLVYIKTASLLPRYEKEEDPRAELVGQLLEYQSCKQAAALLRLRDTGWSVFTRAPMPLEIDPTYRRRHPISELTNAYWSACGRGKRRLPPQETAFTPLVTKPVVSVTSRIMHLLRGFYRRGRRSLQSIWAENRDRSELVATFMAVLELLKAGRVHLTDGDTELVFTGRGGAGRRPAARRAATAAEPPGFGGAETACGPNLPPAGAMTKLTETRTKHEFDRYAEKNICDPVCGG